MGNSGTVVTWVCRVFAAKLDLLDGSIQDVVVVLGKDSFQGLAGILGEVVLCFLDVIETEERQEGGRMEGREGFRYLLC